MSNLGAGTLPGSTEERDALELARSALSGEHWYVDTSNNYAGGRSETVLGVALREMNFTPPVFVITKVDVDPITGRFDRDRVLRSFEESARRLGLDRIPLVHLHDSDMLTMAEALGPGGAVEGMLELRASGIVDAIGVATGSVPLLTAYLETEVFDAVLCHNRFTLVDQSATPLFLEARRQGMTVFNAAPFGAGLLSAGARPGAKYAYFKASEPLLEWVRSVERVCRDHSISLPAVALAYSLKSPLVDSTVVGVSSSRQIPELTRLSQTVVPSGLWEELEALGPAPSPIHDSPPRRQPDSHEKALKDRRSAAGRPPLGGS